MHLTVSYSCTPTSGGPRVVVSTAPNGAHWKGRSGSFVLRPKVAAAFRINLHHLLQ